MLRSPRHIEAALRDVDQAIASAEDDSRSGRCAASYDSIRAAEGGLTLAACSLDKLSRSSERREVRRHAKTIRQLQSRLERVDGRFRRSCLRR